MAVAFGSAGTFSSYGSATNLTLVAPSSIANGDLLLAYVAIGGATSAPTVTPPAGWSALTGSPTSVSDGSGFNVKYYIFYKIASSEAGNYTFTHSTANICGVVIRYTGVDTSSPFSPTPSNDYGGSNVASVPGFTTSVANTFVIFTEHDWADNTSDTVVPTGTTPTFTERIDGILIYIADGTLASAGTIGTKSHDCNNDTTYDASKWGSYLIGLKPAVAADFNLAGIRSQLNVRRTLLYRPLTIPPRVAAVDIVSVGKADVVLAGKTVVEREITPVTQASVTIAGKTVTLPADTGIEVIPVTQATVTYTGQTVSIGDATPPGNGDVQFASTQTRLTVRRSLLYRPFTAPIRIAAVTDTVSVTQATVTYAGQTVTVRDADVTLVAQATVTVFGKPITEFGLVPILKGTVVFGGQTVALVDPGVDRITVDPATVTFTGKEVFEREVPVTKGSVLFTGQTVTVTDTEIEPQPLFSQDQTLIPARWTFLYRPTTEPVQVEAAPVVPGLFPQGQTSILARWAFLYPAGTPAPLVTPPGIEIIPVYPAGIRFIGQEVTLTGQGEVPIGGGGGVTVPPWIVYGRKHRRRYRALEEIEKRLDERIKRLETEKVEKQVEVQQAFVATPDFQQNLFAFEQLLAQQMAITQALLEAQRRAEAVRQERIQLAILAQRAAEAIDEEEAITMLLLT